MRREKRVDKERFGLLWALAASIGIHLLLVMFTVWVPLSSHSAGDFEPEDTITFSFAQDPEPTTDDPLEDAPFLPIEPEQAQEIPAEPATEIPPVPPVDPAEPQDSFEDQEPEAVEQATELDEPPLEQAVEIQRPTEDAGAVEQPQRRLDMRQALSDFRRSLAQAVPRSAPPSSESDTPRNVVVPDLSEIPRSGFGMGNLVFESRDYDWSDYGRQIYIAIWRAWHNRLWRSTDEFEKWAHENDNWLLRHQTQVRFVIEANGQVTGIVQEFGSGCLPLDDSALDALSEVILPPLPADFPRSQEAVHARFVAEGPIRAMRPSLSRLKAMGLF